MEEKEERAQKLYAERGFVVCASSKPKPINSIHHNKWRPSAAYMCQCRWRVIAEISAEEYRRFTVSIEPLFLGYYYKLEAMD